jgi:hypothetical protein
MSSNLELKRLCQQCGKAFIAKKTSTKFCSLSCGQRNYKVRQRMNKIEAKNAQVRASHLLHSASIADHSPEQDLVDIKMLAFVTSMSRSTIFRLIKDPEFPRAKIGGRLLFDKRVVVGYLRRKYGNW